MQIEMKSTVDVTPELMAKIFCDMNVREWAANPYEDSMPEDEYQFYQNQLFSMIEKIALPDASLFYNHQVRWRNQVCIHPIKWFNPAGWNLRQEIIWERGGGMMMNARMFVRYDERILWFVHKDHWVWNQEHVGLGTIWKIAREQTQQGKEHPVAFPVSIPTRCIVAASNPGDIVLDPFMGSGTSGVACAAVNRKFIGIEISPKYFDIACKRIEAAYAQEKLFP